MSRVRPWIAGMLLLVLLLPSLAIPVRADTTEWPPLDPGYHYVTTIVVNNVYTGTGVYAVFRDGLTTSTATARGDIVPGAGPVAAEPGPDWRNNGTAPQWRRFACPGENNLAAGEWYWNKYWQVRGDSWVLVNAFWVFAADHPCTPTRPAPVPPPASPPPTESSHTYWKGYPPPPPFSDLTISPPRSVVNLKTDYQVTGGQPDPGQGQNVIAIEELPTRWSFGDGATLEEYDYNPGHVYTWSSFGQPCPAECVSDVGDGLDAYRVEVTRRWRVLYERQLWETDRWHSEEIWGECSELDPATGTIRKWDCVVGTVRVSDPDALLWSEVQEKILESGRTRWLPVIEVKGANLGQP
ncbi:MAG: hypothetical protein EPO21_03730 [Chloroflexota bacterium]|nr:MAG: hypothetical protein EPO21_03730 [Chloroflexota bacterium]